MKINVLVVCLFLAKVSLGQCSLELSDTTHISCHGENTGSFSMMVTSPVAFTITLNTGAVLVNSTVFSNLYAGNYQAVLIDNNLCTDTVRIKIKEPQQLNLDLECFNSNIISEVNGGVRPYQYFWRDIDGNLTSNDSIIGFLPAVFYDFEVVDSKNCSLRDTVFIEANFTVNNSLGEMPFDLEVYNNSTSSNSSVQYYWEFGDGSNSTSQNPFHTYNTVGKYDLVLLVSDQHQCQSEKTITIEVQGFDFSINDWKDMYNAFSPNGDGLNDQFSFGEHYAIIDFKMNVYNRWGALVMSWNQANFVWNGYGNNGSKLNEGVYYYQMNATGVNGNTYQKKGVISIYQ